jgi:replicative DNA helicase
MEVQQQLKEITESVLGAILLEPENLNIVSRILKTPEMFEGQRSQLIYKAMLNLQEQGVKPDIITVTKELSKNNSITIVGGAYEISKLTNKVVRTDNLDYHATLLYQAYCQRRLLEVFNRGYAKCSEPVPDVPTIIETAVKELSGLLDGADHGRSLSLAHWVDKALMLQKEAMQSPGTTLIPLRSETLKKALGGLKKQRLYIVAARPGEYKTVVGGEIAYHASVCGYPTALFAQEMSGIEMAERYMSKDSGVDGQRISNYCINNYEFNSMAAKDYTTIPLYIDDTPGLTMTQLRSRALKEKRDHNIQLMVVDYLQLCEPETPGKQNREQEISKISRGLKKLAKELDIPVVALSQLNRKSEEKANKKPALSELRDSGSIEQDADTVILLHRPDLHGQEKYNYYNNEIVAINLLVMIVAKNRGGGLGEYLFKCLPSNLTFNDYE